MPAAGQKGCDMTSAAKLWLANPTRPPPPPKHTQSTQKARSITNSLSRHRLMGQLLLPVRQKLEPAQQQRATLNHVQRMTSASQTLTSMHCESHNFALPLAMGHAKALVEGDILYPIPPRHTIPGQMTAATSVSVTPHGQAEPTGSSPWRQGDACRTVVEEASSLADPVLSTKFAQQ